MELGETRPTSWKCNAGCQRGPSEAGCKGIEAACVRKRSEKRSEWLFTPDKIHPTGQSHTNATNLPRIGSHHTCVFYKPNLFIYISHNVNSSLLYTFTSHGKIIILNTAEIQKKKRRNNQDGIVYFFKTSHSGTIRPYSWRGRT